MHHKKRRTSVEATLTVKCITNTQIRDNPHAMTIMILHTEMIPIFQNLQLVQNNDVWAHLKMLSYILLNCKIYNLQV